MMNQPTRILCIWMLLCLGCTEDPPPSEEVGGAQSSMSGDEVTDLDEMEMEDRDEMEMGDRGGDEMSADPVRGQLVINEVVAKPEDGELDWIELYVPGDEAVSLSDYALVDEDPAHTPFVLPDDVVEPGSFWRIEVGEDPGQFPYGLGGEDLVRLLRDGEVVDELSWSSDLSVQGYSYGRYPNGEGEGELLIPTPKASNQRPDTTPQSLFPTDEVIPVHLELDEESWQAIQDDPLSENYY